jgi:putative redox protein
VDSKVVWQQRMSFTGTANSGFSVPIGGKSAAGSDDEGFRPMELLLTGLAGCTAMDVVSILQKKRQEITAFEVKAHAERAAEHPRVFTSARIDYIVCGHGVDEDAVIRSIELSTLRYCPAHAMFRQVFPIALKYAIYEDQGGGNKKLVKEGEYMATMVG